MVTKIKKNNNIEMLTNANERVKDKKKLMRNLMNTLFR